MLLRAVWLYGKCSTNALFSLFKLLYYTEVNKKYKILDFIKMRALFISYSVSHIATASIFAMNVYAICKHCCSSVLFVEVYVFMRSCGQDK